MTDRAHLNDIEAPALVYIGTDGTSTVLDRIDWHTGAVIKADNSREHAILLGLMRYVLQGLERDDR